MGSDDGDKIFLSFKKHDFISGVWVSHKVIDSHLSLLSQRYLQASDVTPGWYATGFPSSVANPPNWP